MFIVVAFLYFCFYYICALIYFLLMVFRKDRIGLMNATIIIFLPLVGIFIVIAINAKVKNKEEEILFYNEKKAKYDKLYTVDRMKSLNTASILDILIFNDAHIKREMIMDIFKGDSVKYVKELKIALNDHDTEVSHYASATLSEIKRKYDNAVIALSGKMAENPEDNDIVIEYVTVLNNYLSCDILDTGSKNKYVAIFCKYARMLLERGYGEDEGVDFSIYKALVIYSLELQDEEVAIENSILFSEKYENDISYFTSLELYYKLNNPNKFFEVLDNLKNSSVILSRQQLNVLRYFESRLSIHEVVTHGH